MAATLIWGSGRELWLPLTLTIHSLTISNKLYKASASKDMFELCVVNGRINTSEFGGDRIEIAGSPINKIAEETHSLESEQPWKCMDGSDNDVPTTVTKGRFKVEPFIVHSITDLFNNLMDYAHINNKLP
ncbi:hypothetical protein K1719_008186 [Acacia pycnantha]|nr:hypothetical protein K1719_008186 [Acacia pycnantha]